VLRRVVALRRDAHQVVGKARQVVGGQRVFAEGVEDQVVFGLDVVAGGFQLGNRDRLDQCGHLGQALAEGLCRGRAVVEPEAETGPSFIVLGTCGCEEALRLQLGQRMLDPLAARGRQLVARRALADDARQGIEVEGALMRAADRLLQALRLAAGLRMAEGRAQDVRQLQHQAAQVGMEAACLVALRHLPGVRDQARRHLVVAAQHLALGAQRSTGVAEHLFQHGVVVQALARTQARRRGVPQLGQCAAGPGIDGTTDLAFELQCVTTQALAFDAARRHLLQHRVHQVRQGLHGIGAALGQHDREVVAQGGQVAVGREQGRTQVEAVDRRQPVALALAGEMKDQLVLVLGLHVHRASSGRALRLRGFFRPHRVFIELAVEAGTDVFGRAHLAGMAQVFVARGGGVAVQDAHRNRVVQ
jgi:hypothetical protein